MVHEAVGYDADNHIEGRKRFMSVDTLGVALRVLACHQCWGTRKGQASPATNPADGSGGDLTAHNFGRWEI